MLSPDGDLCFQAEEKEGWHQEDEEKKWPEIVRDTDTHNSHEDIILMLLTLDYLWGLPAGNC